MCLKWIKCRGERLFLGSDAQCDRKHTSIPESIVVGVDLNGHYGTNVDGYSGVHGG